VSAVYSRKDQFLQSGCWLILSSRTDARSIQTRYGALAAKSTKKLNRIQFDLVSARVELVIGHLAASRLQLQRILDSARAHHRLGVELEARLALAELKRKLGKKVETQADLLALEKLARGTGSA
jgi:hypothetical protein